MSMGDVELMQSFMRENFAKKTNARDGDNWKKEHAASWKGMRAAMVTYGTVAEMPSPPRYGDVVFQ